MSATLRLVGAKGQPISIGEFFELLSPPRLDNVEADVIQMRERFHAVAAIRSHEEFRTELFRFYVHVQNWFSPRKLEKQLVNLSLEQVNPHVALNDLTRWYKGDLGEAERHALYVREHGGFIGVIDKMLETILAEQMEAYFSMTFFDYLPVGQDVRIRLAEELLAKYGDALFFGPDIKKAPILAANIEVHLKRLAMSLYQIHTQVARW